MILSYCRSKATGQPLPWGPLAGPGLQRTGWWKPTSSGSSWKFAWFSSSNKSFAHVLEMVNSGAEIIDVGGESTRPGSKTISPKTEWNRVSYVLKNLKALYHGSNARLTISLTPESEKR